MALSTAVSVASFSVVLAETFSAVMLSTLIPATFVETANTVKRIARKKANEGEVPSDAISDNDVAAMNVVPGLETVRDVIKNIAGATAEPTDLHLLLPKTATIDAEFEFHGSEVYSAEARIGAMVELVNITAGYSALYETGSSNKIKLHIEFQSVNIRIGDNR